MSTEAVRTAEWKLEVDRESCIGTGVCAGKVPQHIEIRDGKAFAPRENVGADDELIDAADLCPMAAILITDIASGRVLAPEE